MARPLVRGRGGRLGVAKCLLRKGVGQTHVLEEPPPSLNGSESAPPDATSGKDAKRRRKEEQATNARRRIERELEDVMTEMGTGLQEPQEDGGVNVRRQLRKEVRIEARKKLVEEGKSLFTDDEGDSLSVSEVEDGSESQTEQEMVVTGGAGAARGSKAAPACAFVISIVSCLVCLVKSNVPKPPNSNPHTNTPAILHSGVLRGNVTHAMNA